MSTTTAIQILRSELTAASHLIERPDYAGGEIIQGERRIAMGTEWDTTETEDGETESVIWGWTWTTYAADEDGTWEEIGTDASQSVEAAREAARWVTDQD